MNEKNNRSFLGRIFEIILSYLFSSDEEFNERNLYVPIVGYDTKVNTIDDENLAKIKIGKYYHEGRANEDRHIITDVGNMKCLIVFDGHGRSLKSKVDTKRFHCVNYLEENFHICLENKIKEIENLTDDAICRAIEEVCVDIDQYFNELNDVQNHGSCATIVLIAQNKIFQANIGDCRSVIFTDDEIISATVDCTPFREKNRIIEAGGHLSGWGTFFRVNGSLAVSRAFGDISHKYVNGIYSPEGAVSVVPEIIITPRYPNQYILLASDGLFDGFNDNDSTNVVKCIRKRLLTTDSLDDACKSIVEIATHLTTDDITMILAVLN